MSRSIVFGPTYYRAIALFKQLRDMGGIIDLGAMLDTQPDNTGLRIYIPYFNGNEHKTIAEFPTGAAMIRWLEACQQAGALVPTAQQDASQ